MPLPIAVTLAAILTIPAPGGSSEVPLEGVLCPAPETVLVIARPEKSDSFLSARTQFSADDLLIRNPDLVRATRKEEVPYDLRRAADNTWEALRHSDLPVAQTLHTLRPATVPEPGNLLLLSISSLLLLRRRRHPFGGTRTDGHQPANHHWSVSNQ